MYVPKIYDKSSGFVINSDNKIGFQCDIIIYQKDITPHIENFDNQNFFPIESVVAVGEVKSTINSPSDLNKYLIKLSELKKFRKITNNHRVYRNIFNDKFEILENPFHNIFTFITCHKFNFKYNLKTIDYGDID
jgi:hypothetical protein